MEEKHPKLNLFLQRAGGVVHVGASTGQERDLYGDRRVLWVEPIPEVFNKLLDNIKGHPSQAAVNALLAGEPGPRTLHVASNGGESSSLYGLKEHKKLHRNIGYTSLIEMHAITLDALMEGRKGYDALVLDTQGSELEILGGGEEVLKKMRFVKAEAWSIEAYEDIPMREEIELFLEERGFSLIHEEPYYGGKGWDLVFERISQ